MSIPNVNGNERPTPFTTPVPSDTGLTLAMLKGIGYLQRTKGYSWEQAVTEACLSAQNLNAKNSALVAKIEALRNRLLAQNNQT